MATKTTGKCRVCGAEAKEIYGYYRSGGMLDYQTDTYRDKYYTETTNFLCYSKGKSIIRR